MYTLTVRGYTQNLPRLHFLHTAFLSKTKGFPLYASASNVETTQPGDILSEVTIKKRLDEAELVDQNQKKPDLVANYSFYTEEIKTNRSDEIEREESARLPLPSFDLENIGLRGRWKERHGNFVLMPQPPDDSPRGVIHFIGIVALSC